MSHIIYCGVDFHARQQTICCLKTETGEFTSHELKHDPKEAVRKPSKTSKVEARNYTSWYQQIRFITGLGKGVRGQVCLDGSLLSGSKNKVNH